MARQIKLKYCIRHNREDAGIRLRGESSGVATVEGERGMEGECRYQVVKGGGGTSVKKFGNFSNLVLGRPIKKSCKFGADLKIARQL